MSIMCILDALQTHDYQLGRPTLYFIHHASGHTIISHIRFSIYIFSVVFISYCVSQCSCLPFCVCGTFTVQPILEIYMVSDIFLTLCFFIKHTDLFNRSQLIESPLCRLPHNTHL